MLRTPMAAAGGTAEGQECFAVYRKKGKGKNQIVTMEKGVKSEAINTVKKDTEDHPVADLAVRSRQVAFTSCSCVLQRG